MEIGLRFDDFFHGCEFCTVHLVSVKGVGLYLLEVK